MTTTTLTPMKDRTDTHSFDWQFETHDTGAAVVAAVVAAKELVKGYKAGRKIKFAIFDRDKNCSTRMIYKHSCYIGLVESEPNNEGYGLMLRTSDSADLEAGGSHSIIPSWNPGAGDPVLIAASIVRFLTFKGTDFFIEEVL
jgi:hypothetical protein